ncbi:hypothetical protein [Halorubrum trueperi]|uniref:Uncharacterized protein n=1 Tax=Halorubrum trueperi TaxID=2004704 RepID=A0ABD5ULY8_9EURY
MRCSSCETREAHHRAVVDIHDGTVLGGYCRPCERTHFGETFEHGEWGGDSRCLLCGDSGRFALALREIEFVETPDGEIRHESLPVDSDTPRLCGSHLRSVLGVAVDAETEQLRLPEMGSVSHPP